MHQVNEHEDGVPKKGVKCAENHPPPETEEHTADGEGNTQVKDPVDAVRSQVGQEEEDIS